jgi:hypothetical protein
MTKSPAWTEPEIRAVVELYAMMRRHVNTGEPYNKARMIRNQQGPIGQLRDRSRGSIEAKLMNITGALDRLGRDDLSMSEHGYRPLANMQKALFEAVQRWAASVDDAVPAYDTPPHLIAKAAKP